MTEESKESKFIPKVMPVVGGLLVGVFIGAFGEYKTNEPVLNSTISRAWDCSLMETSAKQHGNEKETRNGRTSYNSGVLHMADGKCNMYEFGIGP